jgi:hypothetical protein
VNTAAVKDFQRFVKKEVLLAIADLGKLSEAQRIHVQKLVYTNLVDRFDTLVDTTILYNCREDVLVDEASKDLTGSITEADLVRLLMHSATLQAALDTKLQGALRNSALRQRHSKKLETLFRVFAPDLKATGKPRVNPATGEILDEIRPANNRQPLSICGYADWLYSRRNAVVHGGGESKYLENDKAQLKKLFNCQVPATFKIKLSSVQNAATFYLGVADILLK